MANGFFLGGMAEGIESVNKRDLAERTLAQDASIRKQQLGLQERQIARAEQNDLVTRADKQISDTMSIVGEMIKTASSVGKDPATIMRAVAPLVDNAKQIAQRIGRDPAALDAQVQALTLSPNAVEAATAAGRAEGTKSAVSQQTAASILNPGGTEDGGGLILDPVKRGEAENKLRDDYTKATSAFSSIQSNFGNIAGLPKDVKTWKSADDIAATFSYLKILDPTSVASPGEQAAIRGSGSLTDQVATLYNRLLTTEGAALGPGMRQGIRERATTIFNDRAASHRELTDQYTAIAKRQGLNPKNIIMGTPPAAAPTVTGTSEAPGGLPPPPPGFNLVR